MNFDNFVGSSYEAAASLQDTQLSINYFVEMDQNEGAKTPKALLSAPGLSDLGQSTYTGEVRGMWAIESANSAIVVIGNSAILMTATFSTDLTVRPTYAYSFLGFLRTSTGPVGIRDNGSGRICVIVDGSTLYVYDINANTFTISADPAFLGSYQVCEIDGFFIFAQPGTQVFFTSPVYWNGTDPFNGTYFALKDDASDPIVSIIENNRELWLIGSATTEIWYMQGGANFPLGRLQGTMQQYGSSAVSSVARYGTGLIWLSRSERGNNEVVLYTGYQHSVISNPAISYQLNKYATVSDAIGYVYSEEGHTFYVLILPTANRTLVFDLSTGQWADRASFDPSRGVFNRQRANCLINFKNTVIVGDYSTGQIYWQTRTTFADGDFPLVSVRRAPHMWDQENRARIRYSRLQIEFKPGSAPVTGTYIDPKAILSWSDDGGQSFGNTHMASIGKTGETKNRVMWRRLGIARDRVFQVSVSDPVNRDIVGCSVMGTLFLS